MTHRHFNMLPIFTLNGKRFMDMKETPVPTDADGWLKHCHRNRAITQNVNTGIVLRSAISKPEELITPEERKQLEEINATFEELKRQHAVVSAEAAKTKTQLARSEYTKNPTPENFRLLQLVEQNPYYYISEFAQIRIRVRKAMELAGKPVVPIACRVFRRFLEPIATVFREIYEEEKARAARFGISEVVPSETLLSIGQFYCSMETRSRMQEKNSQSLDPSGVLNQVDQIFNPKPETVAVSPAAKDPGGVQAARARKNRMPTMPPLIPSPGKPAPVISKGGSDLL